MSFHLPQHFDAREANRAALRALIGALVAALIAAWISLAPGLLRTAGAQEADHRYPWLENQQTSPSRPAGRVTRLGTRTKSGARMQSSRAVRAPLDANGNRARASKDPRCLPWSIRAALAQVTASCGPLAMLSTERPGARIPTGQVSLHADCQAADFKPRNYACAYSALKDWRHGLSLDGPHIGHIHISAPGIRNEGRFYHYRKGFPRTLSAERREHRL